MLLLHLVDLTLLLLHNFRQLKLVLELGADGVWLDSGSLLGRFVHLEHFLLAACRVHIVHGAACRLLLVLVVMV